MKFTTGQPAPPEPKRAGFFKKTTTMNTEDMKAKRAEYNRRYYHAHKDKVRAAQRSWQLRNQERRADPQRVADRRAQQLAAEKRLNAAAEATAKRRRKEWSAAESAALMAMNAAEVRCIDIARQLGRTVFAVRTRACRLWSEALAVASGSQQGGAA